MTTRGLRYSAALSRPRLGGASLAALLIAASAYLAFVAGSTASAGDPSQPTCQSGRTLFANGMVRAFQATESNAGQAVFVCASPTAVPVVIDNPGPAIGVDAGDFHVRGARLGFEFDNEGLGARVTNDNVLGWMDLQTDEVALDPLNPGTHELLPDYLISYAFAPNGTMAVIAGSSCEVVAVLPIRAKPFSDVYRLGPPLAVFTAHHGRLVHWSIAITATTVRWRTLDGREGSAPRFRGSLRTGSHSGGC
jgi:hypothetical protein